MLRNALLMICVSFAIPIFSQTRITGVLYGNSDTSALPLVQLFKKTGGDSMLLKSVFIDKIGNYTFAGIGPGVYLVLFSSLNFRKYYPNFVIVRPNNLLLTLDTVVYKVDAENALANVTVTASKPTPPLFEQQNEKLVFNVENSIVNIGNNGLETFQRIPGLFVNPNGNISINGQTNPQIRLNGRQLNLPASDIAEFLRNLDVGMIKKIEVSVTPGTSTDAAGSAGVINIILKKSVNPGLTGSASFTHRQSGIYTRDNASFSVNYLNTHWSLYNTVTLSKRKTFDSLIINRNIPSVDSSIFQRNYNKYPYSTASFNTGATYMVNTKTDISLSVNGNFTKGETDGANTSLIYAYNSTPAKYSSSIDASNNYKSKFNNTATNLNYTHRYDSIGSYLSTDIDYAVYNQTNNQLSLINERTGPLYNNYNRVGDIPNTIYLKSADVQYFRYLDTTVIIKGGLKAASSITENQSSYWIDKNGMRTVEADKTTAFRYSENIFAGFTEIQKSYKRNNIVAGLRVENTNFSGNITIPKDTSIKYNRTDLFPFLYIDQKVFRSQAVSFTYSRRIDRPSFSDLNPIVVYYDPYTYIKGNPNLKPQFTNKYELAYTIKRLPLLKISYSSTDQAITSVTYQNDTALTTFKTVDNLASKKVWNFSTIVPIPIGKKFMSFNYFSFGITNYKGFYGSQPIAFKRNSFSYNNNTTLTLKKDVSLEAGAFYTHGMLYGLFNIGDIWAFNMGVQKQFLKRKLSLKLSVSDLFRTQISEYTFKYSNIDLNAKQYQDTRGISLAINYLFGINRKNNNQNQSSIEAEKNRVKQAEH